MALLVGFDFVEIGPPPCQPWQRNLSRSIIILDETTIDAARREVLEGSCLIGGRAGSNDRQFHLGISIEPFYVIAAAEVSAVCRCVQRYAGKINNAQSSRAVGHRLGERPASRRCGHRLWLRISLCS